MAAGILAGQRASEQKFHKTTHTTMIFTDDLFVLALLSEDEEIDGKRGLEYKWQFVTSKKIRASAECNETYTFMGIDQKDYIINRPLAQQTDI